MEDAAGYAASSSPPSDADRCKPGIDTETTKAVAAATKKDKAKIPMLAQIIEANVHALGFQFFGPLTIRYAAISLFNDSFNDMS